MRQFHVLFSGSDASYLMRLSAGYITDTSESKFSVHTAEVVDAEIEGCCAVGPLERGNQVVTAQK
jgi:hypothetical protein